MAGSLWGVDGPDVQWSQLLTASDGSRCNIVCQVACKQDESFLAVAFPCNSTVRLEGEGIRNFSDKTFMVSIFGGIIRRESSLAVLVVDGQSQVVQHRVHVETDFKQAIEICAGIGVCTWGLKELGIKTQVAVEMQLPFVEAFRGLHPETQVIHGDVTKDIILREACMAATQPGLLVAGFSCQPYSRGGSQKGGLDSRAATLGASLSVAFFLRIPIVVLECVPEAATNKQVRKEIKQFCDQCRYCAAEAFLKLENIWPSKRERWWIVLTAAALGPVGIKPLPIVSHPSCIRQILPRDLPLPEHDREQLLLGSLELEKFLRFQPNLEQMLLNRSGLSPTALHSMGSQVVACECGCRNQGFSDGTLAQRGIYGHLCVASKLGENDKTIENQYRHPHPDEIAVLTLVPIPQQWPGSLRLMLAGLGQQANPAHALWIVAQALAHVEFVVHGMSFTKPRQCLDLFMDKMRIQARDVVHKYSFGAEMDDSEFETAIAPIEPSQAGYPTTAAMPSTMAFQHMGDESSFTIFADNQIKPCVIRLASPFLTVGNLRAAEAGCLPTGGVLDILDPLTEEPIGNHECLAGKCVLIRPLQIDFDPEMEIDQEDAETPVPVPLTDQAQQNVEVSPTMPFTVVPGVLGDSEVSNVRVSEQERMIVEPNHNALDPLAALSPDEFVQLRLPSISTMQAVVSMTTPQMSANARLQVLGAQQDLWADDEIRWHVVKILEKAGNPSRVFLDPLIATAVVAFGQAGLIYQWFRNLNISPSLIVSVVLHEGHWVPIVWTWTADCLTCHSWDVQRQVPNFNVLHDAIAKAVGARTYITHTSHRQFAPQHLCGICAVRWIDHFVTGKMLPTSTLEAEQLQEVGKSMFVDEIQASSKVHRPWLWGAGLDVHAASRFRDLLIQHGVPVSQVENRIALATQAIGEASLQKAVIGSSPWRSIKALANQVRPPMQLVLPDELAESLRTKAGSGTIGAKKKKAGDRTKPLPKLPPPLDPSKLVLDEASFVSNEGTPLQQVSTSALGPATEGVAVATVQDVEQFLRNGVVVSPGALGVFVINSHDMQVCTDLPWAQCRIAMKCVTNGEPMLVQGVLVQLGNKMVVHAKQKHAVEAGDVQAACAKITIYRDVFPNDWQEFLKTPVRFVLNALVPLQQCDKTEGCSCSKWHRDPKSTVRDPVFDVWRRQWMNLSFQQTAPHAADVFAVNLRFDKKVEASVCALSGNGGLFIEPRSLDGKSSVDEYQVIWLPRTNIAEVQHLRQTKPAICGIVRMGSRLGVRVTADDASNLARDLRPDTIVLQGGQKVDYEVGPIPFGMDRAALAAMCANWGWKTKPINPVRSVGEGLGMIWLVQAVVEPPAHVFCTKQGEVVVNKAPTKQNAVVVPMAPVASSQTLHLCSVPEAHEGKIDPLVRNDPWAKSVSKVSLPSVIGDPSNSLKQIEERIERAVLSKLPSKIPEPMDVDSSSDGYGYDHRMEELEAQMKKLTNCQQHLENKVDEAQRRNDAQFTQLQSQVSSQIDLQSSRIEDLFKGQLTQIESLLGKRARME